MTSSQLPNRITSPPWWQLINWIADPIGFEDRYSQKYGDIFTMRLFGLEPSVVIGNPQLIDEIFNQDSQFDVGRGNAIAAPLIGQNSLMLMDGVRH
jgi:unspecific monooxygenase